MQRGASDPCSGHSPTRSGSSLIVSGLSPAITPTSKSSLLVAVYVHLVVDSCVCHVVTRTASGDAWKIWISQCGSTLYWNAYQLESFCFSLIAHVTRPLLS